MQSMSVFDIYSGLSFMICSFYRGARIGFGQAEVKIFSLISEPMLGNREKLAVS